MKKSIVYTGTIALALLTAPSVLANPDLVTEQLEYLKDLR